MKGDFSNWDFDGRNNFSGVLHQQGRVLLDTDWNAQTRITANWQDQAGRDAIGPAVAAIPAGEPQGFKVVKAGVITGPAGDKATLDVMPGRTWADGLLVYLDGKTEDFATATATPTPTATYLEDPGPPIAPGIRDGVVLEVWRESVNGFQMPEELIEPALGGPDTTERLHTAMAFRLLRLEEEDTCETFREKLKHDLSYRGNLKVTLAPVTETEGDCPVMEGGGYTGFEHSLYRIEIARLNSGASPMFKWSGFNGGLVGRGKFDAAAQKVVITANLQPIITSGLDGFYLEAVEFDKELAHWEVTYGAKVTLNSDNEIELPATALFGSIPASGPSVFFRLWNGIEEISDFPFSTSSNSAKTLINGIRLEFDIGGGMDYKAGDFWTFKLRAGGIGNSPVAAPVFATTLETDLNNETNTLALQTEFNDNGFPISSNAVVEIKETGKWLITDPDLEKTFSVRKESGVLNVYHLNLIKTGPPEGIRYHRVPLAILNWDGSTIEEEKIDDCRRIFHPLTDLQGCCTVTVGRGGDFNKIQKAVDFLDKEAGGRICLLPGEYVENVDIHDRANIFIHGCGEQSKIMAKAALPVIDLADSTNIRIESLTVTAHDEGIGIHIHGSPQTVGKPASTRNILLTGLMVEADSQSAIKVMDGRFVTIRESLVEMEKNTRVSWPAIFFVGDDGLIQDNKIQVLAGQAEDMETPGELAPPAGRGGLQIGGTSDRVRIINNLILGGSGNGITLGHILETEGRDRTDIPFPGYFERDHPCYPCFLADDTTEAIDDDGNRVRMSAGALTEIHILGNRIYGMGMNGVGVAAFFNPEEIDKLEKLGKTGNLLISVNQLTIRDNDIRNCLQGELASITKEMLGKKGYGGISLADVENLVIRENRIEDNGTKVQKGEPICGVFVLHGEGVDISENRISNNGAKVSSYQQGPRGGIAIVKAVAPSAEYRVEALQLKYPLKQGVPAVTIHDNVVVAPAGRALSLTALGPVSVTDNQFTTRDICPEQGLQPYLGATVSILNLGVSNELYGQLFLFFLLSYLNTDSLKPNGGVSVTGDEINIPAGTADPSSYECIANGNVLFSNNQCLLDLFDSERDMVLLSSSIMIATLDDIGFHGNQCDFDAVPAMDFILSQAILFGFSLRVSNNRFKEGVLFNSLFSAITLGLLNMTTHNQATHCLWISGFWGTDSPNTVLWSSVLGEEQSYCSIFKNVFGDWKNQGE